MTTKVSDEMLDDTLDLSGKTITMPSANTPAFVSSFESSEQSVVTNSAISVAHGLGAVPKLVRCVLRCKITDLGYAVGDEVDITGTIYQNTAVRNGFLFTNATNVGAILANNDMGLLNKSTYATGTITAASWRIVLYAFR